MLHEPRMEKDLNLSNQYICSQSCVCTKDLLTNFASHNSEINDKL